MGRGLDGLVRHLVDQIALCGEFGALPSDFVAFVKSYYTDTSRSENDREISRGEEIVVGQEPIANVDRALLEQVWKWLISHADVRLGENGQYEHLTLAEAEVYNAVFQQPGPQDVLALSDQDLSIGTSRELAFVTQSEEDATVDFQTIGSHKETLSQPTPPLNDREPTTSEIDGLLTQSFQDEPESASLINVPPTVSRGGTVFEPGAVPAHETPMNNETNFTLQQNISNPDQQESMAKLPPTPLRTKRQQAKARLREAAEPVSKYPTAAVEKSAFNPGLRLYTSANSMWYAITGHASDLNRIKSLDFICLSIIAACGPKGILQHDLIRVSGQDKRSVPHRTDRLHECGYIEKSRVTVKLQTEIIRHTSICVLKRFVNNSTTQPLQPLQVGEVANATASKDQHEGKGRREGKALGTGNPNIVLSEQSAIEASSLAVQAGIEDKTPPKEPRAIPSWTADRFVGNQIFDIVDQSGTKGMSYNDIRDNLFGDRVKKPLENWVSQLVDFWQLSQPLHLRHLAMVKDTIMKGKSPVFHYYTYENFKVLVDSGKASWEAVASIPDHAKNGKYAIAALDAKPDLDEYGFPKLDTNQFQGPQNDATLTECVMALSAGSFKAGKKRSIARQPRSVPDTLEQDSSFRESANLSLASQTKCLPQPWTTPIEEQGQETPSLRHPTVGITDPETPVTAQIENKTHRGPYTSTKGQGRPRKYPKIGLPVNVGKMTPVELKKLYLSQKVARDYDRSKVENEVKQRIEAGGNSVQVAYYVLAATDLLYCRKGKEPLLSSLRTLILHKYAGGPMPIFVDESPVPSIWSRPRHFGWRSQQICHWTSVAAHTYPTLVPCQPVHLQPEPQQHQEETPSSGSRSGGRQQSVGEDESALGYTPSQTTHFRPQRIATLASPAQTIRNRGRPRLQNLAPLQFEYLPSVAAHSGSFLPQLLQQAEKRAQKRRKLAQPRIDPAEYPNTAPASTAMLDTPLSASVKEGVATTSFVASGSAPLSVSDNDEGPYPGWKAYMSKHYDQQSKVIKRRTDGIFFGHSVTRRKRNVEPEGYRPKYYKLAIIKLAGLKEMDWFSDKKRPSTTTASPDTNLAQPLTSDNPEDESNQGRPPGLPLVEAEKGIQLNTQFSAQTKSSHASSGVVKSQRKRKREGRFKADQSPKKSAKHESLASDRVLLPPMCGFTPINNINPQSPPIPGDGVAVPFVTGSTCSDAQEPMAVDVLTEPMTELPKTTISNGQVMTEIDPQATAGSPTKVTPTSNVIEVNALDMQKESAFDTCEVATNRQLEELTMKPQEAAVADVQAPSTTSHPTLARQISSISNVVMQDVDGAGDTAVRNRDQDQVEILGNTIQAISDLPSSNKEIEMQPVDLQKSLQQQEEFIISKQHHRKKPVSMVTRRGGSTAILRREIIMQILEKCEGVFPGHRELQLPFADEWSKRGQGGEPDSLTIKNAVDNLCSSSKLRKISFTFQTQKGLIVTKSMLTLPSVEYTDPKVKEVQGMMKKAHPYYYIPKAVLGEMSQSSSVQPSEPSDKVARQGQMKYNRPGISQRLEHAAKVIDKKDKAEEERLNALQWYAQTGTLEPPPRGRPKDTPRRKIERLATIRRRAVQPRLTKSIEASSKNAFPESLDWLPPEYAFSEFDYEAERSLLRNVPVNSRDDYGPSLGYVKIDALKARPTMDLAEQSRQRMRRIAENAARIERNQTPAHPIPSFLLPSSSEYYESPYAPTRPSSSLSPTDQPRDFNCCSTSAHLGLPAYLRTSTSGKRTSTKDTTPRIKRKYTRKTRHLVPWFMDAVPTIHPPTGTFSTNFFGLKSLVKSTALDPSALDPSAPLHMEISTANRTVSSEQSQNDRDAVSPMSVSPAVPVIGETEGLRNGRWQIVAPSFMDPIMTYHYPTGTFSASFSGLRNFITHFASVNPERKSLLQQVSKFLNQSPVIEIGSDSSLQRNTSSSYDYGEEVDTLLNYELKLDGLEELFFDDRLFVHYKFPHPLETVSRSTDFADEVDRIMDLELGGEDLDHEVFDGRLFVHYEFPHCLQTISSTQINMSAAIQHFIRPKDGRLCQRPFARSPTIIPRPFKEKSTLSKGGKQSFRSAAEALTTSTPALGLKRRRLTSLMKNLNRNEHHPLLSIDDNTRPTKLRRIRGPREITTLGEEGERLLLTAVSVIRLLTGGIEKRIDWALVTKVFEPRFDETILSSRWNHTLQKYKIAFNKMESDFQETFIKGYEEGSIPTLDYNDLVGYDWKWLVQWAMANVDTAIHPTSELPADRSDLNEMFDLKGTTEKNMNQFYEMEGHAVNTHLREAAINRYPYVRPLHQTPQKPLTDDLTQFDTAKSWVRANVITPEANYTANVARDKILALPETIINDALKQLLTDRVLGQENKGRIVPGRNYDVSEYFIARLKRNILPTVFQRAAAFKQQLDSEFAEKRYTTYSSNAEDGDMLAIFNLMASRRITIAPVNAPLNKWGHMDGGYETRQMDKRRLDFEMQIRPLSSYVSGNPLLPLPSPPLPFSANPAVQNKIPLWCDIHDNLMPVMWEKSLAAVMAVLALRPGVGKEEIEKVVRPGMEAWEIGLVLEWMVETKTAVRTGESRYRVGEWWWLALAEGSGSEKSEAVLGAFEEDARLKGKDRA